MLTKIGKYIAQQKPDPLIKKADLVILPILYGAARAAKSSMTPFVVSKSGNMVRDTFLHGGINSGSTVNNIKDNLLLAGGYDVDYFLREVENAGALIRRNKIALSPEERLHLTSFFGDRDFTHLLNTNKDYAEAVLNILAPNNGSNIYNVLLANKNNSALFKALQDNLNNNKMMRSMFDSINTASLNASNATGRYSTAGNAAEVGADALVDSALQNGIGEVASGITGSLTDVGTGLGSSLIMKNAPELADMVDTAAQVSKLPDAVKKVSTSAAQKVKDVVGQYKAVEDSYLKGLNTNTTPSKWRHYAGVMYNPLQEARRTTSFGIGRAIRNNVRSQQVF